jgi:hypothetical protein
MNERPNPGDNVRIVSTKGDDPDVKEGAVGECVDCLYIEGGEKETIILIDVRWPSGYNVAIFPGQDEWEVIRQGSPEWKKVKQ